MIFQGEQNPNFTFEKLDEKFKIEAKKWLPMVKDDYQILYAWQFLNNEMAIIVFWDCRDDKIYILRLFAMNNNLGASLDVERSLLQQQDLSKQFICTDPDNGQYGRWLGGPRYEFKEKGEREIINLDGYTKEEIESYISPYYRDLEQLKDIYGNDSNWIIAECIFEQTSGLY